MKRPKHPKDRRHGKLLTAQEKDPYHLYTYTNKKYLRTVKNRKLRRRHKNAIDKGRWEDVRKEPITILFGLS